MNADDLDRVLSDEQEIVPSSGFVANVMEAVRAEAEAPPPIPFPWKWAVPGLAAWACLIATLIGAVVRQWREPVPVMGIPSYYSAAGWIVAGLLLAYLSFAAATRFARRVV